MNEFIARWEASESLDEVAAQTGMPHNSCSTRASQIRDLGIPLKCFQPPRSGKRKESHDPG